MGLIGQTLGEKLGRLVGSGDYEVVSDVAQNSLMVGGDAKTDNLASAEFGSGRDVVRIKHREFMAQVITGPISGEFNNVVYPINPGLSTFPFVSAIANRYEQYRIAGMVVEYISTSSNYTATTAMGTVIINAEYNSAQPPYQDQLHMENSDYSASNRFDKNVMFGIECSPKLTGRSQYFVRSQAGPLPLTDTDHCLLQVATAPATTFPILTAVGNLYISYDIEFTKPILQPQPSPAPATAWISFSSTGGILNLASVETIYNTSLTWDDLTPYFWVVAGFIPGDVIRIDTLVISNLTVSSPISIVMSSNAIPQNGFIIPIAGIPATSTDYYTSFDGVYVHSSLGAYFTVLSGNTIQFYPSQSFIGVASVQAQVSITKVGNVNYPFP
jgi:hypothetical protein